MELGIWLRASLYAVAALMALLVFLRVRWVRVRQVVLLIISYALYLTWGPWFLAILLGSTVINFLVGRRMQRRPSLGLLWLGVAINLVLLGFFKYLPGIAVSVPVSSLQKLSHLALPLGISFWTFQAMSYLLDLYRGEELDPCFVEFALYMAFFPVVISGPICRLPSMLPQFRSEQAPSRGDMGRGLCRIATGILMMQVAQLVGKGMLSGQGVNAGFDQISGWSGPDVWCLAFGYALQVFFDFAGYSHIAIGAARMLGFELPENFARPFTSTTPSIFWTRWHMSLSFWIRDYVFLPVAMMRRGEWWRKFCLLLAMVLFGIWHRGTILFVLFGCYHGLLLIGHRQTQQLQQKLHWRPTGWMWVGISWMLTMGLVNLGWIFFRANSLSQAGQMFSALLTPGSYTHHSLHLSLYGLVLGVALAYAGVLFARDALDAYAERRRASAAPSGLIAVALGDRWVWIAPMWATACVLVVTMVPHQTRAANIFMYRQF